MIERKIVPAGQVEWARFTQLPPRFTKVKTRFTRQQKEGLRYERRAVEYLEMLVEKQVQPKFHIFSAPWIIFRAKGEDFRYCQPDALLVNHDEKVVIIVEIKYQHTNMAWKQVRLLYEPVVKEMDEFRGYSIRAIELSKWLDPHSPFPEQYYYAENVLDARENAFGIHLFKPSREKKKGGKKL